MKNKRVYVFVVFNLIMLLFEIELFCIVFKSFKRDDFDIEFIATMIALVIAFLMAIVNEKLFDSAETKS